MSDLFLRFPPFIQDFIYRSGWQEMREVQIAAAEVLFNTDDNLLLTTSTASGKTEAAFFPILTQLSEDPANSFAVLYIAPLKSLINDQFSRMDELLAESGIPTFHWHGDVAASHKAKALRNPKGILQITPESLESMLINRSNDIPRLFCDLRYVIVDELHTLTGSDRGNQILCQLCRLQRLIGRSPRRIGLSATVGDTGIAAAWLSSGTERRTAVPRIAEGKLRWRLGAEHFYIQNSGDANSLTHETISAQADSDNLGDHHGEENTDMVARATETGEIAASLDADPNQMAESSALSTVGTRMGDPGYEYIFDCVKGRKSLVFTNSREEAEFITATMRQIAQRRGERDFFSIHHGNLSAAIREEAELALKNDETVNATCATVTLELGIDIGKLERIVQIEAPNSVSSMLQRLGRSGRRGAPPEMMMVFREEVPLPNTPLPQLIPWRLLQAIAIIQLYAEERFIEPPTVKKLPFSLMFQQTLSVLAASGELTAAQLAGKVMSLPPFAHVSKEDYKTLLLGMLQNDFIEKTETGGLIVGLSGERLTNSFKFYAVFKDSEDYTVRCGSDEIGTITTPPPVGDRFALAGRVWEVEELDLPSKLIYVRSVEGKMEISWPGDYGEIHTRILERMRRVLSEDVIYPYLKPNAAQRLRVARETARRTGMLRSSLVHLGGYSWCLFPWLGTRSFRTLRKLISKYRSELGISAIDYEGCYYISFRMEHGNAYELLSTLCSHISDEGIDLYSLSGAGEVPVFDKYDDFVPASLLRRAYAADKLRHDEIMTRLPQLLEEFISEQNGEDE
ncbi:MAG: DEAD/DEAH box helicase [Clostridia bacterium]|nr:DEAD/DEAH box helicase [Clostridia bacterium]